MKDPTEAVRRMMIETDAPARDLQRWKGKHIDTETLRRDYEVLGFLAPFVLLRRKADGKRGQMEFTHQPRVYFDWRED
jgi:hypothetical protein